jgi:lambda family phage portal protein
VNIFEKAIAAVAPGYAVHRALNRFRLEQLARTGYEGGALGRRTQGWKTSSRDANAEIAPALKLLRNRSRDLRRNNPYAEAGMSDIVDNMVGYGIKPKAKGRTKTLTKRVTDAWKAHAETTAIDYDGKHDVYGLQALACSAIVESGAVLVRRRLLSTSEMRAKGLTLPFQIQVLEPDFIDLSRDGEQPDGAVDIKGIRFEPNGGVRGYWLYDVHPGAGSSAVTVGSNGRVLYPGVSRFVPARDVLHVFRMDRAGQVHGVPWAAPVMLRMRNFDDYEDAQIERQKIAACFALFFSGLEPDGNKMKQQLSEKLEPGMISFAPPGTTPHFATPPSVEGYRDFSSITLHAIAAGLGVPYEAFGDLAGVNFSSGRMGWQKYQRRLDRWQWQMFIPGFCAGVWGWFSSSLQFMGITAEDVPATHIPPRRMMVNPKEEIAAIKEEIRNGLTSYGQAVTERGNDEDEQIESIAASNAKLDAAGVKLDCDPRFALPAGSAGATNGSEDPATRPEDQKKDSA